MAGRWSNGWPASWRGCSSDVLHFCLQFFFFAIGIGLGKENGILAFPCVGGPDSWSLRAKKYSPANCSDHQVMAFQGPGRRLVKPAKLDWQICNWGVPDPVSYSLDIFGEVLDVFDDFGWRELSHKSESLVCTDELLLINPTNSPPRV